MNARNRITAKSLVIGFLGIGIFPATYQATRSDAVATATQVNTYETPCELRARTERGIPALSAHDGQGLVAWTRQHLDGSTPDAVLADYWAALDACDATAPVGKWDWSRKVLVNVEYLR